MFPIQCDRHYPARWRGLIKAKQCQADAVWHLGQHAVDSHSANDYAHQHLLLCEEHYHQAIQHAAALVEATMEGWRESLTCLNCDVPLTRLSNILKEMERI